MHVRLFEFEISMSAGPLWKSIFYFWIKDVLEMASNVVSCPSCRLSALSLLLEVFLYVLVERGSV